MVQSPSPSHFGNNKDCVTSARRGAHAWLVAVSRVFGPSHPAPVPPHRPGLGHLLPHSVRRMMWMPESVNTGPLISPVRSAKEASSNGFCI